MEVVKDQAPKVVKEIPAVQWDMLKIAEGNGADPAVDEKNRQQILKALTEGFEPFAISQSMTKKSSFDQNFIVTNWIYFKRPSFIKESIDDSDRLVKP